MALKKITVGSGNPEGTGAQSTNPSGAATAEARTQNDNQLRLFEQGIREFKAQRLREARELFLRAADGPLREIGHHCRVHIAVCDRRLGLPSLELNTVEDHYNYAVERINARDLDVARRHLTLALGMDPNADHVYYGLALVAALIGDSQGAYENLKRAIELEPRNRLAARQDHDFASIIQHPPFSTLLFPDRSSSF